MVEFALVLPVLVALILGVLDTSRGAVAAASLSNATREAARYGAIHHRESGWQTEAQTRAQNAAVGLDLSQLTVTPTTETSGGSGYVRVTSSYVFRPAAPFIGSLASEITLTANARMLAQ